MEYVKWLEIDGVRCLVQGIADERVPGLDRLNVSFGPASFSIWDKEERKAFIAALIEADAQMDAASKDDVA